MLFPLKKNSRIILRIFLNKKVVFLRIYTKIKFHIIGQNIFFRSKTVAEKCRDERQSEASSAIGGGMDTKFGNSASMDNQ